MKTQKILGVGGALVVLAFSGAVLSLQQEPMTPLPIQTDEKDLAKALLGRTLFQDPVLSKDGTQSCNSCHQLEAGGMDGLRQSVGIGGAQGHINAPTVFNSSLNFVQFWNGRAKNLEDQIDGPIENPIEMANSWDKVLKTLQENDSYRNQFRKLYSDGITEKNVKNAIATFERQLVTPNSRFDRYLRGESDVLSKLEIQGYQNFKSFGCVACHQGQNIGGNMFQTMGVMGNYFKDRGSPITNEDLGRFVVTKKDNDKFVFRVPSLRNVALTAPYFHDGSAKTLEQAVAVMGKYQLGQTLNPTEIESLCAFLRTLTGDAPGILKQKETP